MADEGVNRRLAAILSADVKDYSRLLGQDEVFTIRTLKAHREVITGSVEQYRGRVIDTPGDNVLATFESVSSAVNCAVEIQRELAERNAEVPSGRVMEWRIGIELGDVVEEEGKVYGDGVNIAARIEKLTEAGGIGVSGTVYDKVKSKLGLEFESLGEKQVRNIPDPIHVYRVLSHPGAAAHQVVEAKGDVAGKWRRLTSAVAVVAVLCVGAVLAWNYVRGPADVEPDADRRGTAGIAAEKPSIAVLPFDNMSGDPEQEYFSDGISEDILNGLARNRGLDVIASTSSFQFKDIGRDVREIGKQLDVTHVVEGSVRKAGNRIRVTAQLVNTDKGTHLWSKQYDRNLTDVFEIQDEIAGEILEELNIHLLGTEGQTRRAGNMEAYEACLLGRYQLYRGQIDEATVSFQRAASLDPGYADAYGMLALAHAGSLWWEIDPASKRLPMARNYINKALAFDPGQVDALGVQAAIRFFIDRDYQQAIDDLYCIIQGRPSDVILLNFYAMAVQALGRFDMVLRIRTKMIELDPLNPMARRDLGLAYLVRGHLTEARNSMEMTEALGDPTPVLLSWLPFAEGDAQALREQLDHGESAWGTFIQWYRFYDAAAAYLEGEREAAEGKLHALWHSKDYVSYWLKSYMAALDGDLDLGLDYYAHGLRASEPNPLIYVQRPLVPFFDASLPAHSSHPKYQKMLRDVGLDEESVSKLKIPPLSF